MNTLNELLVHPVFQRLGWTLVHSIWQGALVAIFVAILLAILGRRSSQARYLVACAGLSLMLVALVLTFFVLPGPILRPDIVMPVGQPSPRATGVMLSPMPAPAIVTPPAPLTLAQRVEPFLPACAALWIIGIAAISIRHVGGWVRVQQLRKRATPLTGEPWDALMRAVCEKLRVKRAVAIAESALVQVPSVVGYFKPVILLPICAMSGLSPQQLEGLIAHELAHVRRHDYLVNLVQIVIETLLFYHPAAWWLSKRIRQERENCCDDLAANVCGNQIAYVQALAAMEELRMVPGELVLAARGGSLLPRVRRLLGVQTPRQRSWSLTAAIVVVIVALVPLLVAQHKAKAETKKSDDAALQKDDLVRVTLTDLVGPQVVTQRQAHISSDGDIDLPLVGKVRVDGQLPPQAERTIQTAYRDKNIVAKLQVTVSLVGHGDAASTTTRYSEVVRRFTTSPVRDEDLESKAGANPDAIRPNDVLQLSVLNLVGADVETKSQVQVNATGAVQLPQAGAVTLAGLTLGDAETAIKKAYHDQKNIDVQVRLSPRSLTKLFRIEGAVEHPGHYKIETADFRLLDALKVAGALKDHGPNVYVERISEGFKSGKLRNIEVPLAGLLGGDTSLNVLIFPNDVVSIPDRDGIVPPDRSRSEVYVGGDVKRSGVYSMGAKPISVKQILIAAGIEPRNQNIRLVRQNLDGTEEYHTLSFQDLISGATKDFPLQVLDEIMVTAPTTNQSATTQSTASRPKPAVAQTQPFSDTTAFPLNLDGDKKATLDTKLPEINFNAVALSDVIDFLRDVTNANIFVDWKAIEAAGVSSDAPVTVRVRNVSFGKALELVLDSVSDANAKLGYSLDDNVIRIGIAKPVSATTQPALSPEKVAEIEQRMAQSELENDMQELAKAKATISALEPKYGANERNVVEARQRVEALTKRIAELTGHASASAKPNDIDPQMKALLEKKLPEAKFDAVAVSDVIDFLRDITGANIFVNWNALEAAGIDKNAPVSMRLREVAFSKVLDLLLDSVGGGTKLAYTANQGVINISTAPTGDGARPTTDASHTDARTTELRAALQEAELQLQLLQGQGYGEQHPKIAEAKKLLEALRQLQLEAAAPATAPATEALYKAVRIVVGPEKMTLEGKETTWDKATEELAKLPNRGDLVLEVAVASDQMTLKQHNEAVSKGMLLASELKFKYLSDVGVHPLESKASHRPAEPTTEKTQK